MSTSAWAEAYSALVALQRLVPKKARDDELRDAFGRAVDALAALDGLVTQKLREAATDDAIYRSLERQDKFYRNNRAGEPPIGIEERHEIEGEKRRRREAGVPE
jgi:hypothetical protein